MACGTASHLNQTLVCGLSGRAEKPISGDIHRSRIVVEEPYRCMNPDYSCPVRPQQPGVLCFLIRYCF
jgi:hypothetical protein